MGLGVEVKMEGGSCWLDGLILGQRQLVHAVRNVNLTARNLLALALWSDFPAVDYLRRRFEVQP
jgi:hypothetical protein